MHQPPVGPSHGPVLSRMAPRVDCTPCQEATPGGQRRVWGFPTPAAKSSGLLVSQLILGLFSVHSEAARSHHGPWQAPRRF